jgi:hypothetical protein
MRHRPKRAWFAPWKTRCRCGCAWYRCPDAVSVAPPPVAHSLRGDRDRADWNAPTEPHAMINSAKRPLMTPGQQWRSSS